MIVKNVEQISAEEPAADLAARSTAAREGVAEGESALWRGRCRRLHTVVALATGGVAALAFAGCPRGAWAADDNTLRVAVCSPGEVQIRVGESVAEQFEAANDGWKADLIFQDDDMHQTIGHAGGRRLRRVFCD